MVKFYYCPILGLQFFIIELDKYDKLKKTHTYMEPKKRHFIMNRVSKRIFNRNRDSRSNFKKIYEYN